MSKAQKAAEAIKANPHMSDRAIAKEIGSSPTTVGKVRTELSTDGKLRNEPRVGLDGKQRPMPTRHDEEDDNDPDIAVEHTTQVFSN